jgi:surface antigen
MKHAAALAFGLSLVAASHGALADACSGRDHTGDTIAGGLLGGILGGVLTRGSGVGIVGGALLGGLAGNAISRDMDCEDRPYAARSYDESFHGPVGRRYEWSRGPNHGYIVTNREYYRGPRLCRDFTQVVYRRGREFDRGGTACQRRDGSWEFL